MSEGHITPAGKNVLEELDLNQRLRLVIQYLREESAAV